MAHSIQIFNSKAESFRDGDLFALVVWLKTFLLVKDDIPFKTLISKWEAECISCGPGTIDLKLSDLESQIDFKEDLKDFLGDQIRKLSNSDTVLSGAYLQSKLKVPGVVFSDYPSSRLLETITKLKSML